MQSKLMNSSMRNGLILGVLFSLNFIFSASGVVFLGLLTYVIVGFILYYTYHFAVDFRDKECNGTIGLVYAFLFVVMNYFFATIISSFVKYFYLKYINKFFLESTYNNLISTFEKIIPNMTEEMYESVEAISDPQSFTLLSAWSNFFIAMIVGMVIAIIVRRKNNNSFDNFTNN